MVVQKEEDEDEEEEEEEDEESREILTLGGEGRGNIRSRGE